MSEMKGQNSIFGKGDVLCNVVKLKNTFSLPPSLDIKEFASVSFFQTAITMDTVISLLGEFSVVHLWYLVNLIF